MAYGPDGGTPACIPLTHGRSIISVIKLKVGHLKSGEVELEDNVSSEVPICQKLAKVFLDAKHPKSVTWSWSFQLQKSCNAWIKKFGNLIYGSASVRLLTEIRPRFNLPVIAMIRTHSSSVENLK